MNTVRLVVAPTIDWKTFVGFSNASLGRSPTASLDGAGLAPGSMKTFVAAIGEFITPGTSAIRYIKSRESDRALEHLSFTFLINTTPTGLLELLKLGRLSVSTADSLHTEAVALVSGTLRQWREVILEGSRPHTDYNLRLTLNQLSAIFTDGGLQDLFAGHEMKKQRDGTITIEHKG